MFWAPCGSGGGGVGGWGLGATPHSCAHACTHTHACACTHAHAHMVNMIISCKWPPQLGESLGIPYDVIHTYVHVCVHACVCACMCVHVHMGGVHPLTTPKPIQPTPTPRGIPGIIQNSIALELIEIFQFCLKI